MYIYTTKDCKKVLLVTDFSHRKNIFTLMSSGEQALKKRKELEEQYKVPVVAWCQMGEDNETPEITINE